MQLIRYATFIQLIILIMVIISLEILSLILLCNGPTNAYDDSQSNEDQIKY